jgi:hypothetical protein
MFLAPFSIHLLPFPPQNRFDLMEVAISPHHTARVRYILVLMEIAADDDMESAVVGLLSKLNFPAVEIPLTVIATVAVVTMKSSIILDDKNFNFLS